MYSEDTTYMYMWIKNQYDELWNCFWLLNSSAFRINKLYIKSKCIEVYEGFRTLV